MKYHYQSTQRMASIITMICFMLFVSYSMFLFKGCQSDILALANFVAKGTGTDASTYGTEFASWTATWLGTLLCSIPALFLLYSLHFPIYMKGVAFLPSYVVLGLMTGVSPSSTNAWENDIPIFLTMLFLIVSAGAIFYTQIYREDKGEHAPLFHYLGGNILLMCFGMMICMSLTNTDRHLHLQLHLAKAVLRHDYILPNTIMPGETTTSNNITSIRALSLSKQGRLADDLFSIHGLRGSCCLLPDSTPSALIYHTPQLIYNQLQAIPVNFKGNAVAFLQKAVERRMCILRDSTVTLADSLKARPLMDYYLCALLLDKDLSSFIKTLPKFYMHGETLPRHYREALAIYYADDPLSVRMAFDASMDSMYVDYLQLKHSVNDNPVLQRKICKESYPDTYWNYYFFVPLDSIIDIRRQ